MNRYILGDISEFDSQKDELEFYRKKFESLIWFVDRSTDLKIPMIKDYFQSLPKFSAYGFWKEKLKSSLFDQNNDEFFVNCHDLYEHIFHYNRPLFNEVAEFYYSEGYEGGRIPYSVFKDYIRRDRFDCLCEKEGCPRQDPSQEYKERMFGEKMRKFYLASLE